MHHVGPRLAKLAFVAVISCAITACGNTDAAKIKLAQEVTKKTLRDPDSAQFDCEWKTDFSNSQKERYITSDRLLVCQVRAKNAFGGYGNAVAYDFQFEEEGSKAKIRAAYWYDVNRGPLGDWRRIWIK